MTQQLLRPGGVLGLCEAMFGEEETSGDAVKFDKLEQVAKTLVSVPAKMAAQVRAPSRRKACIHANQALGLLWYGDTQNNCSLVGQSPCLIQESCSIYALTSAWEDIYASEHSCASRLLYASFAFPAGLPPRSRVFEASPSLDSPFKYPRIHFEL